MDISREILNVKNLSVRFKSKNGLVHTAVDDISLTLRDGDVTALVGESGSGKTTLARAVMGLVERAAGTVSLFGKDTSALNAEEFNELRRMCGYIPQDPYGAIPPGLSALDAVTEPAVIARRYARSARDARALRARLLLKELGLDDERILRSRAVGLSGGQRQRVEIARALMLSPKLLICDEPTSMQDVSTRGEIIEVLYKRVSEGMSMIFITHDLLLAGRAAKSILVMKDGRLCEYGSASDVLDRPKHEYTRALLDAVPRNKFI